MIGIIFVAIITNINMMNRKVKFITSGLLAIILIITVSCDPSKKIEADERETIRTFISNNNVTVQPTESGLYYIEITAGTGNCPVTGDSVVVNYAGYFLNGNLFGYSTATAPFGFVMGNGYALEGFEEGISYMRKGGTARLLLPSKLGYGTFGTYGIPGYTPLLFQVELLNVIHLTK